MFVRSQHGASAASVFSVLPVALAILAAWAGPAPGQSSSPSRLRPGVRESVPPGTSVAAQLAVPAQQEAVAQDIKGTLVGLLAGGRAVVIEEEVSGQKGQLNLVQGSQLIVRGRADENWLRARSAVRFDGYLKGQGQLVTSKLTVLRRVSPDTKPFIDRRQEGPAPAERQGQASPNGPIAVAVLGQVISVQPSAFLLQVGPARYVVNLEPPVEVSVEGGQELLRYAKPDDRVTARVHPVRGGMLAESVTIELSQDLAAEEAEGKDKSGKSAKTKRPARTSGPRSLAKTPLTKAPAAKPLAAKKGAAAVSSKDEPKLEVKDPFGVSDTKADKKGADAKPSADGKSPDDKPPAGKSTDEKKPDTPPSTEKDKPDPPKPEPKNP